jgi:hypothetical protein
LTPLPEPACVVPRDGACVEVCAELNVPTASATHPAATTDFIFTTALQAYP